MRDGERPGTCRSAGWSVHRAALGLGRGGEGREMGGALCDQLGVLSFCLFDGLVAGRGARRRLVPIDVKKEKSRPYGPKEDGLCPPPSPGLELEHVVSRVRWPLL